MEPSRPADDAPCPHCGCLIWFDPAGDGEVDRELTRETFGVIRAWVQHITELSTGPRSAVATLDYFRELVEGFVRCLAARGGAIWLPRRGKWKMSYHVGLQDVAVLEEQLYETSHVRLVQETSASGCPSSRPPRRATRLPQEEGNPTHALLLLCPIKREEETRAVVEVFQRPEATSQTQRGYLRFLEHVCYTAGKSPVFSSVGKRPWWRFWG